MKIYSSYKDGKNRFRMKNKKGRFSFVSNIVLTCRNKLRRKRGERNFHKTAIQLVILLGLAGGLMGMFYKGEGSTHASVPASSTRLMINPSQLYSFQNIPTIEPEEFEPENMDTIKDVVEDIMPDIMKFTKNDIKYKTIRVKKGDNLWDIARDNGIRISTIIWANSNTLDDPSKLHIGQVLSIPNLDVIAFNLKKGNTIWSLSKKYSVSMKDIHRFNEISNPDKLMAGKKIYIPNPNLSLTMLTRLAASNSEGFLWPSLRKSISSRFGYRIHPVKKRKLFHEGVDIRGYRGAQVYSADNGKVTFVGWIRGYGKTIVIKHKRGLSTRYAHLRSTKVRRGHHVEKGQIIGTMGSTGLATGPHLHFEVRKNGLPQNPMKYF